MLIQVLALTLMNKLLPRANVNWGAAILGGPDDVARCWSW